MISKYCLFVVPALLLLASCEAESADSAAAAMQSAGAQAAEAVQPSGPADLSEFLAFVDPADCTPSESLRALSRGMVEQNADKITAGTLDIPGVGSGLRPEIETYSDEGSDGVVATLDLPGIWNGLTLREIVWDAERRAMQHPRLSLNFSEPFDDVIARLNALGFPVPLEAGPYDGEGYRSSASDVGGRYVEAHVVDAGEEYGVAFSCFQMEN